MMNLEQITKAEDARRQALEDFVAWLMTGRASVQLRHVADLLDGLRDPYYDSIAKREIDAFADAHGWPDTLRAIAQAMQMDERHKRELMDRR